MNVYVESNFVLELALQQEQSTSCQDLIRLCACGQIALNVPAYCLAEPYETLARRRKDRHQLKKNVDDALRQLERTSIYAENVKRLEGLTSLLISSTDDEKARLDHIVTRIIEVADVIALEPQIMSEALVGQRQYDFSPQDAIVYASVISHLRACSSEDQSCFLNRNSKDFDDQNVVDELSRWNCKLLTRFDDGLNFVRSRLA